MEYKGRKYRKLYAHLCSLPSREWEASFADVETLIGDNLPASARGYQAWWANDATHSQGTAWLAAGWETAQVDMDAETLLFRRGNVYTPDKSSLSPDDALNALDQLQISLSKRQVDLANWAQNLRAERHANGP